MADKGRAFELQRIQQAVQIADQFRRGIFVDAMRAVGLSITPHVGRNRTIACGGKRWYLMSPGECELRKTVHHDDGITFALFIDGHADTVAFNKMRIGKHAGI